MKQHDSHAPPAPPRPMQNLHPTVLHDFSIYKKGNKSGCLVVKTSLFRRIQPEQSQSVANRTSKNEILINPKEMDAFLCLLRERQLCWKSHGA